jgi:predicted Zn-dependent protease
MKIGLEIASLTLRNSPKKMTACLKIALAITVQVAAFALANPQQARIRSTWAPPPSRKAKTPFAPKPFTGDNIFKGEGEVWLADAVEKLEGGIFTPIDDKVVTEYVALVGNNLVPYSVASKKEYRFIVTTDWTPDAMTAGGGRIYISRGMLAQIESEDELAEILAHEIAHDAFAHASKTVTRQMFWMTGTRKVKTSAEVELALAKLLAEYDKKPIAVIGESLLGFARFDELEADRAAFYNAYKAGYNPAALATILKRMARQEKEEMGQEEYRQYQFLVLLFGNHPPTAQRSMALSWETNFVKMPAKDSRYHSAAFDEMKLRINAMSNID